MKKHTLYYIALSALAMLTGCSNEENFGLRPTDGNRSLTATIEQNDLSRTAVSEEGQVTWTETDAIGVFGTASQNIRFTYQSSTDNGNSATFRGDFPEEETMEQAYYPYQENATLSGNALTLHLPSEYTYTGNSNAPMLGVKNNDGTFTFKHLFQQAACICADSIHVFNIVRCHTSGHSFDPAHSIFQQYQLQVNSFRIITFIPEDTRQGHLLTQASRYRHDVKLTLGPEETSCNLAAQSIRTTTVNVASHLLSAAQRYIFVNILKTVVAYAAYGHSHTSYRGNETFVARYPYTISLKSFQQPGGNPHQRMTLGIIVQWMGHKPYPATLQIKLHERAHDFIRYNRRSLCAAICSQIRTLAVAVQKILNLVLVTLHED